MSVADRGFALLAIAAVAVGCVEKTSGPVVVRDAGYLVARPIRSIGDAAHTIQVDLPNGRLGFAATEPLIDMNSLDLRAAGFAGGRTSVVGEASIWVPLKPEARPRFADWVAHADGDLLGVFLRGRLVTAPHVKDPIGGIFVPVKGKAEGDRVLAELRNGGAPG
jgi:hypothetical protein